MNSIQISRKLLSSTIVQICLVLLLNLMAAGCGNEQASTTSWWPSFASLPNAKKNPVRQDKPDDSQLPRKLLNAAISAHGGERAQNIRAGEVTTFTRGHIADNLYDENLTCSKFKMPNQLQRSDKNFIAIKNAENIFVRDDKSKMSTSDYLQIGNRAWRRSGTEAYQPTDVNSEIEMLRPFAAIRELRLFRDSNRFELTLGEDEVIDGKPVDVILLKQAGNEIGSLAFDKKSNLLVRMSYPRLDPRSNEQTISNNYYSDFQSKAGLTYPTKHTNYLGEKFFFEETLREFKPVDEIDDDIFREPKR